MFQRNVCRSGIDRVSRFIGLLNFKQFIRRSKNGRKASRNKNNRCTIMACSWQ